VIAPDGTASADKLAESVTTSVQHSAVQSITTTAVAHTLSVYAKSAERTWLFLQWDNPACGRYFDLTNGVLGTATGAGGTSTITAVGNGWYRCTLSFTGVAATPAAYVMPASADNSSLYVGTVGSGIYAYGAQLEAGAFATSYIPTTTSQVTRAADVASVNTLSPWFNAVAGTFYFEGDTAVPASLVLRNLTSMNDATVNNLNRTYLYNGTVGGSTTTGGVTQADIGGGSYTVNTVFKFAYATAANNFAAVLNGGAPATDALGTMPSGLTTFEIASQFAGTVNTGHIRRITYYPRRLTNAELQSLTTL
jgi:hypothetical protein